MKTDGKGTILEGYHPSADSALAYIKAIGIDLLQWQEAFASTAIEGNEIGEVCGETLRRILAGEPVSDRYVLGLAWQLRNFIEARNK